MPLKGDKIAKVNGTQNVNALASSLKNITISSLEGYYINTKEGEQKIHGNTIPFKEILHYDITNGVLIINTGVYQYSIDENGNAQNFNIEIESGSFYEDNEDKKKNDTPKVENSKMNYKLTTIAELRNDFRDYEGLDFLDDKNFNGDEKVLYSEEMDHIITNFDIKYIDKTLYFQNGEVIIEENKNTFKKVFYSILAGTALFSAGYISSPSKEKIVIQEKEVIKEVEKIIEKTPKSIMDGYKLVKESVDEYTSSDTKVGDTITIPEEVREENKTNNTDYNPNIKFIDQRIETKYSETISKNNLIGNFLPKIIGYKIQTTYFLNEFKNFNQQVGDVVIFEKINNDSVKVSITRKGKIKKEVIYKKDITNKVKKSTTPAKQTLKKSVADKFKKIDNKTNSSSKEPSVYQTNQAENIKEKNVSLPKNVSIKSYNTNDFKSIWGIFNNKTNKEFLNKNYGEKNIKSIYEKVKKYGTAKNIVFNIERKNNITYYSVYKSGKKEIYETIR